MPLAASATRFLRKPAATRGVAGAALLALALTACTDPARLTIDAGTGPSPTLPEPRTSALPTVNLAPAAGWPDGAAPTAATGLTVRRFAAGLEHPRWLLVLPGGDVLVAESNTPAQDPSAGWGRLRNTIARWIMKRAGSGGPSANRITLLRDADGDGVAEFRSVLLEGLTSPIGMALVGDTLYVANTDGVLAFGYRPGQVRIDAPGRVVVDLPAGPINHHWTKNLIASADGKRLYASVGSNSNVGENGEAAEAGRAAIWEIDPAQRTRRPYATGLRNPVGMAWEPRSSVLWTVVNERDELGSDLVPDYLTSVRDGDFFGWPHSYFGNHVDARVTPARPDLVARARVPDYALGPHTASLGLAWSGGTSLPAAYAEGMFVGQHGSWNREPRSGYRVLFVPFRDGRPAGAPLPVLDGFLDEAGRARGRPVGVAIDTRGALLVADDVGGAIWHVASSPR